MLGEAFTRRAYGLGAWRSVHSIGDPLMGRETFVKNASRLQNVHTCIRRLNGRYVFCEVRFFFSCKRPLKGDGGKVTFGPRFSRPRGLLENGVHV